MSLCPPRQVATPVRILAWLATTWLATMWTATMWTATAGATVPPDPVETMARVVQDLDLQTRMPTDIAPPKAIAWSGVHWHIPGGLADAILWIALAAGLGFAIFALRDTLPGLSRRTRAKPDAAVILPDAEAVERMVDAGEDADDLARRGLLAEAMHMLLLRSLVELRQRLDVTIAESLTSREVLQRLTLPERSRHALADLIQRVEFVHFGSRIAGPDDYGACRASYAQLIGAMRAPSAAAA